MDEAWAKFQTKIGATINYSRIYESDENMDSEESHW